MPHWLDQKLLAAQQGQLAIEEVWVWDYKGETVYLFLPACCDRMAELYDEKGNLLCHPSGGITGQGDGNCLKFFKYRKNGILLWKPANGID